MRSSRIKADSTQAEAVYHCMTRTVNGERLIDDAAKEILRKHLSQVAAYCGVQVLTYAILSNHFHVLVKVPVKTIPPDDELLRRYAILYPKPTKYRSTSVSKDRILSSVQPGAQPPLAASPEAHYFALHSIPPGPAQSIYR